MRIEELTHDLCLLLAETELVERKRLLAEIAFVIVGVAIAIAYFLGRTFG